MKELQVFKNKEFGQVRVIERNNTKTLLIDHERNKDRLDKFSVVTKLTTTDGKAYETYLYTAKGVYEICRFSRQPKADAFMDWVWDVVESIRKHGIYATPQAVEAMLNDPDTMIKTLTCQHNTA